MGNPFNAYTDVLGGKTTPAQVSKSLKGQGQRTGKPVGAPSMEASRDPATQKAAAAAKARSDAYLKPKKPR